MMQKSLQTLDAEPHNPQDYIQADHASHLALAEASSNEYFWRWFNHYWVYCKKARLKFIRHPTRQIAAKNDTGK